MPNPAVAEQGSFKEAFGLEHVDDQQIFRCLSIGLIVGVAVGESFGDLATMTIEKTVQKGLLDRIGVIEIGKIPLHVVTTHHNRINTMLPGQTKNPFKCIPTAM